MTTLKELTWENHKRVEKCLFVKKLLKKELTPYQYYVYLSNQCSMYWFLELSATKLGIFDGIKEIIRSAKMLEDLKNIEKEFGFSHPIHTTTTERYRDYIKNISTDKDKLLSHVYVRHLGDLSGGQIIKRFIPVSHTTHYDFDGDVEDLKTRFKEKLRLEHANEANICFDFMFDFFKDLEVEFGF
jgi:heme oxygenase